mmetsp:Transcript_144030/g.460404  ORF Transcript_144030/g.460404 Transcript_144030/m.460404 type:complete len:399 (+) Transcript_144030:105-1301(+)
MATSPCAAGLGSVSTLRSNIVRKLDVSSIEVVSCHAVAADEGLLALGPNTEEVLIFQLEGSEFRLQQTLSKHTQRVTGLAWSPPVQGQRPRLVSCSEDRTAYVWEFDESLGSWVAFIVELASPRAALCVAWAPNGQRFAVGLASKDTAVCYWMEAVESWIAVKVGRSKASVVSVSWHPNSEFLATGSTDGRCCVYNVNEESMLPDPSPPFGELQCMEDSGAWVNTVMFSTSGRYLAYLTQDSSVSIKDLSEGPQAQSSKVRWKGLPFLTGAWLNDRCFVACGFDFVPVLFQRSNGQWECRGSVDTRAAPASPLARAGAGAGGDYAEARKHFAPAKSDAPARETSHTSVITGCQALPCRSSSGGRGAIAQEEGLGSEALAGFSTSGQDGQVLVWEISSL